MDPQELTIETIRCLSEEYISHAYSVSSSVTNHETLGEYHQLVAMSIQSLQYLKRNRPLSIVQDAEITCRLVEILLNETLNVDLAESYLSALRERLKHHHSPGSNWPILQLRMKCEFLSLYMLPMKRDDRFHYKIALKHSDEIITFLEGWDYDKNLTELWLSIFKFVNTWLNGKLGNIKRVLSQYEDLVSSNCGSTKWRSFIVLCGFNFHLNHRLVVPEYLSEQVSTFDCAETGPKLYGWKLMLELIMQIYEDKNITEKLHDFKIFFDGYKETLSDNMDSVDIDVGPELSLRICLSSIFQYKDMKNVLLLLQSVSFLVNCYDKKADFSRKFLPKVLSTTSKLMTNISATGPNSIHFYGAKFGFYKSVQEYSQFYQKWEELLCSGKIQDIESVELIDESYASLMAAMHCHIGNKKNQSLQSEKYNEILSIKHLSNEVKMIALLNSYIIETSSINESTPKEDQLLRCNSLWLQITNILAGTDLHFNTTWDCTITVIWIIAHFEPFTSYPLPMSDDERTLYIDKFREYYAKNKIIKKIDNSPSNVKYKIKKSLMLQILINYVGGRFFEQDLTVITEISTICFRLARQQKEPFMQYIVGLWHLMNCTISMKGKEVVITTAKLDVTVKELIASTSQEPNETSNL